MRICSIACLFSAFMIMCIAGGCSREHAGDSADVTGDPAGHADSDADVGSPSQALEILSSAIDSEDGYIRYYSAVLLGSTGDRRATAPLIEALDDPDPVVRCAAARSLGALRNKRSVKSLVRALGDKDFHVKAAAAGALEEMDWIPEEEEETRAYELAKWEIGERARIDTSTVAPLVEALRAEDEHARIEAARALDRLGWEPADESQRLCFILARGEAIPYRGVYSDPIRKDPLHETDASAAESQREQSTENGVKIGHGTQLSTGFIEMKTEPAAVMRIYLDGRELTRTDETVIEVPTGQHRLEAEDDQFRYYAGPEFVEVRKDRTSRITFELEDLFPPLSKVEMVDRADRYYREMDLYDIEVVNIWRLSRTKYLSKISYRIKDRWYYLWESKPERMASVDKPEAVFLFSLEGFELEERKWAIQAVFTPKDN